MLDFIMAFALGMSCGAYLVMRFIVPVALKIDPNKVDPDWPDSGERG